jgi:hypothetical protein
VSHVIEIYFTLFYLVLRPWVQNDISFTSLKKLPPFILEGFDLTAPNPWAEIRPLDHVARANDTVCLEAIFKLKFPDW